MGVKRDYEGLRVRPCFPAEWEEAEVTRHFRGADYHIVIRNPHHIENGKPVIFVEGLAWDQECLPIYGDGRTHEVEVVLK